MTTMANSHCHSGQPKSAQVQPLPRLMTNISSLPSLPAISSEAAICLFVRLFVCSVGCCWLVCLFICLPVVAWPACVSCCKRWFNAKEEEEERKWQQLNGDKRCDYVSSLRQQPHYKAPTCLSASRDQLMDCIAIDWWLSWKFETREAPSEDGQEALARWRASQLANMMTTRSKQRLHTGHKAILKSKQH